MNRWQGIGRWTQDIYLRYTNSGKAVGTCTLAVNEKYGGQESTVFVPIVLWDKRAETVAKYSVKGRLVYVEGRLTSREYENKEGQRVKVWEVVASDVVFLDKPTENGQTQTAKRTEQQQSQTQLPYADDPFADDEGLPF